MAIWPETYGQTIDNAFKMFKILRSSWKSVVYKTAHKWHTKEVTPRRLLKNDVKSICVIAPCEECANSDIRMNAVSTHATRQCVSQSNLLSVHASACSFRIHCRSGFSVTWFLPDVLMSTHVDLLELAVLWGSEVLAHLDSHMFGQHRQK
jgi:hypothetical protein